MEASLRLKAEKLAEEFADRHTTPEDLQCIHSADDENRGGADAQHGTGRASGPPGR